MQTVPSAVCQSGKQDSQAIERTIDSERQRAQSPAKEKRQTLLSRVCRDEGTVPYLLASPRYRSCTVRPETSILPSLRSRASTAARERLCSRASSALDLPASKPAASRSSSSGVQRTNV